VGESEDVVDLRGMKMQRVGGSVRTRGFRGDGAWRPEDCRHPDSHASAFNLELLDFLLFAFGATDSRHQQTCDWTHGSGGCDRSGRGWSQVFVSHLAFLATKQFCVAGQPCAHRL
jgi:hypothetical protein